MKLLLLIAICFVATSSAQWEWWNDLVDQFKQKNYVLDYVHNYKFVEHDRKAFKLLIAISNTKEDKSCHVIEIDDTLEPYLKDKESMKKVTEEIYDVLSHNEQNESPITRPELYQSYHDVNLQTNRVVSCCLSYVRVRFSSFRTREVNAGLQEDWRRKGNKFKYIMKQTVHKCVSVQETVHDEVHAKLFSAHQYNLSIEAALQWIPCVLERHYSLNTKK